MCHWSPRRQTPYDSFIYMTSLCNLAYKHARSDERHQLVLRPLRGLDVAGIKDAPQERRRPLSPNVMPLTWSSRNLPTKGCRDHCLDQARSRSRLLHLLCPYPGEEATYGTSFVGKAVGVLPEAFSKLCYRFGPLRNFAVPA